MIGPDTDWNNLVTRGGTEDQRYFTEKYSPQPLDWCSFTLKFAARQSGCMPPFPGSAIRGAFGHALKRLVCLMRHKVCDGCTLEHVCVYTKIFEARAASVADNSKRNLQPPTPFVLNTSFLSRKTFQKDDTLEIGFRLFGSAVSASPFVLKSMSDAGEHGLGSNRLSFRLIEVSQWGEGNNWRPGQTYPPPIIRGTPPVTGSEFHWHFVTPVRLRSNGKPVDHHRATPQDLARSVLRRLRLLVQGYGDPKYLKLPSDMKRRTASLRFTDCNLSWKSLQRFSSRQSKTQSVSGFVGTVGLDFSNAPEWGPILAWAPIIHIGKGTSMGLGRVDMI